MKLGLFGLIVALAAPGASAAQVTNGDFTQGPLGWQVEVAGDWYAFPDAGVDGSFRVGTGGIASQGTVCIAQDVNCLGTECGLVLDYREFMGDLTYLAASMEIRIDGTVLLRKPGRPDYTPSWKSFSVPLAAGSHRLAICVTTYSGGVAWLDNIRIADSVPVRTSTWGGIKARF